MTDVLTIILSALFSATLSNPTFWKEFVLLGAAAAIIKPLIQTAIQKALQNVVNSATAGMADSVNQVTLSVNELTKTLQEHIVQTDVRMGEGDAHFKSIRDEIEKIKAKVGIN